MAQNPSNYAAKHELFSILALSIGTLFVFGAFNMQSFIVESVLHSVSTRDNSFNPLAGYYGQAIQYGSYTVVALITPFISYKIGSHLSLAIGALLFAIYLAGFFFLNSTFYYVAQFIAGAGWALFYAGQGLYMIEHSTRKTITRNSSLLGAIGNSDMCFGGAILWAIFSMTPLQDSREQNVSTNNSSSPSLNNSLSNMVNVELLTKEYRYFSDFEIHLIYGVCLAVALIAGFVFILMPRKQYDSLTQNEKIEIPTLSSQIRLIFGAICEPRIFLLTSFYVAYGLQVSFLNSAYPTTFSFTKSLSSNHNLLAFYMITVGMGSIIMGTFITTCSRRWPLFGLAPSMITQIIVACTTYALIWMSTPNMSTIRPNPDPSKLIEPSPYICVLIGLLLGMSDGSLSTMRVIICTLVVPEKKLQTFSVSKMYQSLASSAAFFLSSYLTINGWVYILGATQILGCVGYLYISRKINEDEVKSLSQLEEINQKK